MEGTGKPTSKTIAAFTTPWTGGMVREQSARSSTRLVSSETSQSRIWRLQPDASAVWPSWAALGCEVAWRETSTMFLAPFSIIHSAIARPMPLTPPTMR